jgi:hypothetical protein
MGVFPKLASASHVEFPTTLAIAKIVKRDWTPPLYASVF